MNKRNFMIFVAIVLLFGTTTIILAESTNFPITAWVISPIELTMVNGLDFGRVFKGSPATTVDPLNPLAGTVPATFNIVGEPNQNFIVFLPSSVTLINGSSSLGVSAFTSSLADELGILDLNGTATFRVGATLESVPADVISGTYQGEATITVLYNH